MRDVLEIGMMHELEYRVTRERTVPFLYPDSDEFLAIPEVFATGYMIGLMEWCCIQALAPALDEGEGSLGTFVQSTHIAATPPGGKVKVYARIVEIDGRRVKWDVIALDNLEEIGRGVIERTVIHWERFNAKLHAKTAKIELVV